MRFDSLVRERAQLLGNSEQSANVPFVPLSNSFLLLLKGRPLCWMNSALQVIVHTPTLRSACLKHYVHIEGLKAQSKSSESVNRIARCVYQMSLGRSPSVRDREELRLALGREGHLLERWWFKGSGDAHIAYRSKQPIDGVMRALRQFLNQYRGDHPQVFRARFVSEHNAQATADSESGATSSETQGPSDDFSPKCIQWCATKMDQDRVAPAIRIFNKVWILQSLLLKCSNKDHGVAYIVRQEYGFILNDRLPPKSIKNLSGYEIQEALYVEA